MQQEEKKEYLKSYRKFTLKLRELEEQKLELRSKIESVRAIEYDDMPKGSGNNTDLSSKMVMLEDIDARIEWEQKLINSRFIYISNAVLDMTEPEERAVIYKRYIEFKRWEDIAEEIGYSLKHTHRIHGRALIHIVL